ncbi:uncharacterized protein LOC112638052 [Camponotus floridanus]|uniref:uncharacterized protein LOC112638052 n=1 Tax=Camponotus floridanus TaxID=104421 RepID=UPI000DC6C0F6|nr:uncharacterized protein LOC112638052 [Camponotus floridanus]
MDRLLQALAEAALSQEHTLRQIGESQKQIGESQKQMAEILSHRISGTDDTAKSSQFANLATRLGTKGLTDTEGKDLLLNALGDDEHQQLLSRLSPKKPQEMSLGDLERHLRKQFHDNKTLFQRRFEALNFRASPSATAIEILDKVNVLGDVFELDNFNIDQLKILLTALALSNHTYYTERTVLFKVASEKENCTFQDIREICYAHANRTADVMRVEGQRFSEINAVSQSTKNSPKKERVCLSKQRNKINTVTLQGVLGTRHRYHKFAHITINNKPLKMQLDTGADVTMIGRETWTRIGRPKLQPLTTSCVNVSGHPMHTIGFFNASLGYKDCIIKAQVIVLDRPETVLLSSQAIDELGLITYDTGVVGNLQTMNTITVNSFHKQFTELFSSSTGECTKMTVHLWLKPDVKPKHIP